MVLVFTLLSGIVLIFLMMLSLTLFRIEKKLSIALMLTERKIVDTYGKKS